jgi:transmembrane sensor
MMSTSDSNNNNRRLARAIDEQNKKGTSLPENDALSRSLSAYRRDQKQYEDIYASEAAEGWEQLRQQMHQPENLHQIPAKSKYTSFKRQPNIYFKYAAAALLLIAITSLIYLMLPSDAPEMYTSGSQIETVVLPDGSVVQLRPYSKLTEQGQSESDRAYDLEGEAFFDVKHSDQPFSVSTAHGRINVLGTRFNVRTWSGSTRVFLESGVVQVSETDDGERREMKPGNLAELHAEAGIRIEQAADASQEIGWLREELRFQSRPVGQIAGELEFHFNITIIVPDRIQEERLSGSIALDTPQQAMQDLSLVLEGQFRQESASRYVYEPTE